MARTDIPNVGYPFITFELASQSLVWDKNNRPDYFFSLSNQRYVEKANVTTVNISYVPRYGEDPNKIEAAISNSGGLCRFQYGMAGHKSKVYAGNIYDYRTSFDQGYLNYSIELVSQSVAFNCNTIENRELVVKTAKDLQLQDVIADKLEVGEVEDQNEDGVSDLVDYAMKVSEYSDIIEGADKQEENGALNDKGKSKYIFNIMTKIVEDYCEGYYVFDVEASDKDFTYKSSIDTMGKGPLEALKMIAAGLLDISDPSNYSYHIVVDDEETSEGKGRIYLKRMGKGGETKAVYTFDWNEKNGDVLSWSPSYTGHAAIFSNTHNVLHRKSDDSSTTEEDETDDSKKDSNTSNETDNNVTTTIETTDGEIEFNQIETSKAQMKSNAESIYKTWMSNDAWDKAVASAQAIKDINGFLRAVNYPYEAKLTVLGISDNIYIGDYIQVNPYINGKLHHSGGLYQIKGITDNIDSGGFTTKLDLVKCKNEDLTDISIVQVKDAGDYQVYEVTSSVDYFMEPQDID